MIDSRFDIKDFTIVKDEFISFDLPVAVQCADLCEDMFQAYLSNNNNWILDIGWYGETNNLEGEFIVFVIINHNWDNPLVKISCKDLKVLEFFINTTIDFMRANSK
jgi:hypothetical protein